MPSERQDNPFFKPPNEASLADDDVRSRVRAEFYEIRSRFLDRLACAQVFDRDRFEALLLSLEALRRSSAVAGIPLAESDFDQFRDIASYLEQEATYSRNQRQECAAAHAQWIGIMRQVSLLPEQGS
jgi:hypothetical protein